MPDEVRDPSDSLLHDGAAFLQFTPSTAGSRGAEGAAAPLACSPRKNRGMVLKKLKNDNFVTENK